MCTNDGIKHGLRQSTALAPQKETALVTLLHELKAVFPWSYSKGVLPEVVMHTIPMQD